MMLLLIGLVGLLIFTVASTFYLYVERNHKVVEIRPYDQFYVGMGALAFGLLMLLLFFVFVSPSFEISENLGQVGDFVGGLTNPALSFIALIVLLRTTMIQTEEARKTSAIMLEQQALMQEERFESTFYNLLERYETAAEVHLRPKLPKDKLSFGLRIVQRLRKERDDFDAKPAKERLRALKGHIRPEFRVDKVSKPIARAWKVFDFIEGSSLPERKKKYYFTIFYDAMEPCEMVILIHHAFIMKTRRKIFRKYKPGRFVRSQFFASAVIGQYFGSRLTDLDD